MLTDLASADAAEQLRVEIEELRAEHHIPGMAAGLVGSTGAPVVAVSGSTARPGARPVGVETIFGLQSVSKMYTATATMLAVRDGLVELDIPITEYLPDFTVNSIFEEHPERRMTLRHLLSHTAGFTHEAPVGNNYDAVSGSFPERVASIPDSWLRFPVGERYEYSNLGIDIAGWVLAIRSGMPFEAYMRDVLLDPLGITRTTFDLSDAAADEDRAVGHTSGYSELPVVHPLVPCGGAFTSIRDACRFVQFHLNGCVPLLPANSAEELYQVPFPAPGQIGGYGLGVVNAEMEGWLYRGHGGGGFGYLCDLYWLPEHDLGVAVLTNSTDHPLQWTLASELLRRLAWRAPGTPAKRKPVSPETRPAAGLEGEYVGRGSVLQISSSADGWEVRVDGYAPVPLVLGGQHAGGVSARAGDMILRLGTTGRGQRVAVALQGMQAGSVWCWNRSFGDDPEPVASDEGVQERRGRCFTVRALGVEAGRPSLWSANDALWFGPWSGANALRLSEHRPGLLFSSTGEALDLRKSPPTYANIPLHEDASSPSTG